MISKKLLLIFFFSLAFSCAFAQYDLIVAQDGSGNYTTLQAAVNAAPAGLTTPYKIFIKNGRYREKINIPSTKTFIQLIGESVANTIVYYDDAAYMAGGTSGSASFTVNANDFSALNITFANTYDYDAGVAGGQTNIQAVAVLVNGDRVAFKNCRFLGNQDTLYQNKKGYYKNCYIDGIIDFIFGGGAAIFDSCTVYPKTRTTGGSSYITAANTPAGQAYGYVFRDCKVIGNPGATSYVMGRPWQNSTGSTIPYAENKVVFINSILNANISPAGWSTWDAGTNTALITFGEYQSKYFNNAAVDVSGRVPWSMQLNATQAADYSNANVLAGWNPCTAYANFCDPAPTYIAVSNFTGTKGTGTATFKWNQSWGMDQVKFELFRSLVRNGTYTKIGEVTSPNDTTYNYAYTDNALPPGQQVYYYLLASKAGNASHNTDTLLISSKPTIGVNSSLGNFQQGGGVPSAAQTYIVNGVNLSDNIIITAPANFEISLNGTSWNSSSSPITLVPSSGVIANTTIYVRLNAATAPGVFSGNILHTTVNGDDVNVAVNGTSQTAPLTPAAYYRSRVTGLLSDVSSWETSADSTAWFAASSVPAGGAEENITIMPGHTITVNTAHVVNGKWTVYGTGSNTGGAIVIGTSPGALSFANNSSLVWNRDGGTLPAGTVFNPGSVFNIIGTGNGSATSQLPGITATQVFSNVIINTPNCKASNPNFGGNLNNITGNLVIYSTGVYTSKIRLSNSPTQVINIGGDLIVNPPAGSHATFVLYSTATVANGQSVNIAGNLVVNNNTPTNITGTNGTFATASTAVTLSSANPAILPGMGVTGTGIAASTYVVSVAGTSLVLSANTSSAQTAVPLTFIQSTSSINLTDNNGTGSMLNLKGNITFNNSTITLSSTGLGTININRTDGIPQFYSRTAGSVSSSITWNVLSGAVLDLGTSTLPGSVFTAAAGATLRSGSATGLAGNITATTKNFNSAANYIFNGAVAQTTASNFTTTTPTTNQVNNLTINNAAGVTLGNSLLVNGTLNLTAGKLIAGSNTVTANAVAGGSASNYVVTGGTGFLKINNVAGTDILFPVGPTASSYNPATMSNTGTADNFSVRVAAGVLPPGINVQPQSDSSVNNTWTINEDVAGGSNATIKLQWNTADQNSLFAPANCAVVHSNGTVIDYTGTFGAVTNAGANVFTKTGSGFTAFSPFGVTSKPGNVVVPLSLISFSAKKQGKTVNVLWSSVNEINVNRFEVQRSTDRNMYTVKGIVSALGGAALNNYNFTDADPVKGYSYYRLKIIDNDGRFTYSDVEKVYFSESNPVIIFPNPATNFIKAAYAVAGKDARIIIYSADGKKEGEWIVPQNSTQQIINVSEMTSGVHFLVYSNNNETYKSSFIKK
jgi:pectin methylesterase-like acyl-CoA thioesterase